MVHRKLFFYLIFVAIAITGCQADRSSSPSQPQAIQTPLPTQDQVAQSPIQTPLSVLPTPASVTPTIEPIKGTIQYAIPDIKRNENFATYNPVPVSFSPTVSEYPTTLPNLTSFQATSLSSSQKEALEKNGFVVTPASYAQIYQIYQEAKDRGQPIFVTTDALLHTYHVLYDFALREAEINYLVDDLRALTTEMLVQSQAQITSTSDDTQQAAVRNLAYFSVAASLLDPAFTPPSEVSELVTAELALIREQAGFQFSPIFNFEEDYGQYVPRGHYTRNETFEQYFRAMMWYGRIGFRLRPGSEPEQIEMGRVETRQAILISAALATATVKGEPAIATWERIHEPTAFFVGQADDLTVYDYLSLIRDVYGVTLDPQNLNDSLILDSFIQSAMKLRLPGLVSNLITDQEDPSVTQGFRFMGQRFVPDGYIFQQLVYNKVGSLVNPRFMPSALDVATVLGSERAYSISLNVYGQGQYQDYNEQVAALQIEFANLPSEQWSENLYWGWLYTLDPFLSPIGQGYPAFMQNAAWVDKDLHTYLGSWTELKHDTILYAKQSTTMIATGVEPEPKRVNGYVEPRPVVFARLAALVNQTQRGLDERALLNDEFNNKFVQLESLLLSLVEMAKKELTNQNLTKEEQEQILNIGDTLESLTTFSPKTEESLASEGDARLAIVADVHTDPNSNQVLEQAIGDAFMIWVIAPVDGQPTLTQGGVFSYYEFLQPLNDRLTDEAWQALQPKPAQPTWTNSFIVP